MDVDDGVATLFKALGDDLTAGQQYDQPVTYTPGSTVTSHTWNPTAECGDGLHLGPTPHHATRYRPDATRWVTVAVPVAELVPILGDTPKCKVRAGTVVGEVDIHSRPLAQAGAA